MLIIRTCGARRCAAASLVAVGWLLASSAAQAELSLGEAEALALAADPALHRLEAQRAALEELAIAAGELPDPMARLGVMSLPVDSFDLSQEPMAQVVAGVEQRFPRGATRELSRRQVRERAAGTVHEREDQRLEVLRTVRELYVEVVLQQRLQDLTGAARTLFADLADTARDYYATGRAQQQEVLQAEVERGRIEEQSLRFRQSEREARAALAVYVGDAALGPLPNAWPELAPLAPVAALQDALAEHPRILALRQRVAAADTAVDLARQRYRPEFGVEVSYGLRSGSEPDGASRPDLFSAMLVMDLPLFPDNRQDRVRAARLAQSSAAEFERDDAYRRLLGDLRSLLAQHEEASRRGELFESVLLPQAAFSAESSFDAYQSTVGDLTTLLRARITEYELRLDYARVQADLLRTQARLLYLQGETS